MRNTLWLIRKTVLSTFRNYRSWLLYFVLPFAASAFTLLIIQGSSSSAQLRIVVVNEDGQSLAAQGAIEQATRTGAAIMLEADYSAANSMVVSGEADALLHIPEGFHESVLSGEPAKLRLESVKGAQATAYIKAVLDRYVGIAVTAAEAVEGDETAYHALYTTYSQHEFRLAAETAVDRSVGLSRARQAIGYLLVLMLFSASTLSGIMIKERENRTYLRIAASPAKAGHYIMSNVTVSIIILFGQMMATLLFMTKVLGIELGTSIGALMLVLGIFALAAVGFSLVLVSFSSNSMQVSGMQNLLIIPSSILGGCMFPLELMPEMMQKVATLMPQYWAMQTIGELQAGEQLGSVGVNLLLLLAFALAFVIIAAYKVSRNNSTGSYV